MLDVHSVEFYVIALFVAFALFGLIVTQREPGPATTDIVAADLTPVENSGNTTPTLSLRSLSDGTATLTRTGLTVREGATIHLVITVIDDKLNIQEKYGVKGKGDHCDYSLQASIKGLKARRYYVRYDSKVTEHWGTLRFNNLGDNFSQGELKM